MPRLRRRRAGFSIIELLISLIIISILVAMVILISSQRASEARLRTAQADLRLIAEAEQQAVIDTGYFLRLYVLDDVTGPGDADPALPRSASDRIDALEDELGNTRNPEGDLFGIVPDYGTLNRSANALARRGRLVDIEALVENETLIGWNLPYISYQRIYEDPGTGNNYGVPMDPWGNPYIIATRLGFINDVPTLFGGSQGQSTTLSLNGGANTYRADIFDRFTLISFGPDALPGDAGTGDLGSGDDLILQLN